jgi:hypothetical protein
MIRPRIERGPPILDIDNKLLDPWTGHSGSEATLTYEKILFYSSLISWCLFLNVTSYWCVAKCLLFVLWCESNINTLCGRNLEFLISKHGGISINDWDLND